MEPSSMTSLILEQRLRDPNYFISQGTNIVEILPGAGMISKGVGKTIEEIGLSRMAGGSTFADISNELKVVMRGIQIEKFGYKTSEITDSNLFNAFSFNEALAVTAYNGIDILNSYLQKSYK